AAAGAQAEEPARADQGRCRRPRDARLSPATSLHTHSASASLLATQAPYGEPTDPNKCRDSVTRTKVTDHKHPSLLKQHRPSLPPSAALRFLPVRGYPLCQRTNPAA